MPKSIWGINPFTELGNKQWYNHPWKFHPWNNNGNPVSGNAYGYPQFQTIHPNSANYAYVQDRGNLPVGYRAVLDTGSGAAHPFLTFPPKMFRCTVLPEHFDQDEIVAGDLYTTRIRRGLCGEHILVRCAQSYYANYSQAAADFGTGRGLAAIWQTAIMKPMYTAASFNDFTLNDDLEIVAGPDELSPAGAWVTSSMQYPYDFTPGTHMYLTLSFNFDHLIEGQFDYFPNWRDWTVAACGPYPGVEGDRADYSVYTCGSYLNNARTVESVFSAEGSAQTLSKDKPTCFVSPRWSRQSDDYMALYYPHSILIEPIPG